MDIPIYVYFICMSVDGHWVVSAFLALMSNAAVNFFFFFVFLGPHPQHREVPRLVSNWSNSHCHSNARSEPYPQPTPQLAEILDPLTQWARPGIQPASSWILNPLSHNGNSTAMNFCIQVFAWLYVFTPLGLYLGVELMGHMVTLCLICWETTRLFFKVAPSFYSLSTFSLLVIICLLCCTILVLLWLWFAFPWWLMMLSIFAHARWPRVYLIWRSDRSHPWLIV